MKKCLCLILLLSLFTSCAAPEVVQGPVPAITPVMVKPTKENMLPTQHAQVTIHRQVINTVNPHIFGDNISWRGDGYYLWDREANAPNPDLFQKLCDTGITHLRYPGGIEGDYFNWYEAVGDERVEQIDPFSKDWPTNATQAGERYYPYFGPDEFQSVCQAANMEATIQFNSGTGKPEDAGSWVKHCQDNSFNVLSFTVGNEANFEFEAVEGLGVTKTAEAYIDFYEKAYASVRQVSSDAKVGGICLPPSHPLCYRKEWDAKVLGALGDKMDFIDVHIGYAPYFNNGKSNDKVIASFMAAPHWIAGLLEETKDEITRYAKKHADDIDIHIGEYGPISGGTYDNTLAGALYQASLFHVMLEEPKVVSANHLPVLNHYAAPNLIGSCKEASLTKGEQVVWDNAVTHVFGMYAKMSGRDVLKVDMDAPTFSADAVGLIPSIESVPYIDVAAYDRRHQGVMTVFIINRHQDESFGVDINLPYDHAKVVDVTELWHKDPLAYNNWVDTDKVAPQRLDVEAVKLSNAQMHLTIKPLSLLCIDIKY